MNKIYAVPLASSEYKKCGFKAVIGIKDILRFLNDEKRSTYIITTLT